MKAAKASSGTSGVEATRLRWAKSVTAVPASSSHRVPIDQDELVRTAAAVPDGRLVTIEGAGHQAHENRPDEFLAEVLPFLLTG